MTRRSLEEIEAMFREMQPRDQYSALSASLNLIVPHAAEEPSEDHKDYSEQVFISLADDTEPLGPTKDAELA